MSTYDLSGSWAEDSVVFAAARPGHPDESVSMQVVNEWIAFMKDQGIKRVCCLLPEGQLGYYDEDLLGAYRNAFGDENVCWSPVSDDALIAKDELEGTILAFLQDADGEQEPVVVHRSNGDAATAMVLVAWLIQGWGIPFDKAVDKVQAAGRNPCQIVDRGIAPLSELRTLLRGAAQ